MKSLFTLIILACSTLTVYASDTNNSWEEKTSNEGTWFLSGLFSTDAFANFLLWILVLVLTFLISKIVTKKLNDYFESSNKEHDVTKEWIYGVVGRTVNISIWFIWITMMFGTMGLDMALFMGWIWIGLWFTMQIFLSNFIYGIIMVTQGTVRNGDMIDLGGELSKVEKVNPLFTVVKRLDGVKAFIPNLKFLQDKFANLYLNETRRLELDVSVNNDTDMAKMKLLIAKVMENVPGVLSKPGHTIWFMWLDDKWVNMKILFWAGSKDKVFTIRSNVIETLNLAFQQAGIEISYMDFMNITITDNKDISKLVESRMNDNK